MRKIKQFVVLREILEVNHLQMQKNSVDCKIEF